MSSFNIYALSIKEVMRIEEMITQDEFSSQFNNFSQLTSIIRAWNKIGDFIC